MGNCTRPNFELFEITHAAILYMGHQYSTVREYHEYSVSQRHRQNVTLAPMSVRDGDRILMVRVRVSVPQGFNDNNIQTYGDLRYHYVVVYTPSPRGDFYSIPSVITIPRYTQSNVLSVVIQEPLLPICTCCSPSTVQYDLLTFRSDSDSNGEYYLRNHHSFYANI